MTYITKDSGQRQEFETGAMRDSDAGKMPFDKLSKKAVIGLFERSLGHVFTVPIVTTPPDLRDPVTYAPDNVRRDLIPEYALNRIALKFGQGERKYGANNWTKGIHLARTFASACRHVFLWKWGDTSEDHLAAAIVNLIFLMCTEHEIYEGRLPQVLANAGWLEKLTTRKPGLK